MSLQPPSQTHPAPKRGELAPAERRHDWRSWVITILVILVILALVVIQQFLFSD